MKKKITRENIGEHLLEYQLELIGKTIQEAKLDDMWIFNWTLTRDQYTQFRNYAIPLLKKTFRYNKGKAEETFSWFYIKFGLMIKD